MTPRDLSRKARRPLILGMLFLGLVFLSSAQEKSAQWYLTAADNAAAEERYEAALQLLSEGKKQFPEAPELWIKTGDLYFYREIYRPALREYLAAETLVPNDGANLYQIAQSYGYLNENENSLLYFERLIRHPDYSDLVVDDLAWMYYKTHQFHKGEELLLSRLEEGFNKSYAHTLGTIYSGQYRYEESRKYYRQSIEAAEAEGSGYFASIACYNLSLLEFSFYQYENSLEMVKKSLAHRERAGGYTALGDLEAIRLDFTAAHEAYSKGMGLDDTPLSRMGLAELYLNTGALTAAGVLITEIKSDKSRSWMYYYGTEPEQFEKNLHELEYRLYDALFFRERGRLCTGPVDGLKKIFALIRFKALGLYHRILHRKLGVKLSRDQRALGNRFDADMYAYQASMGYPSVSLRYLEKAERFEKSLTPRCIPWYNKERGRETGQIALLEGAANTLDPQWERAPLAETLQLLARAYGKRFRFVAAREAVNRLYTIAPGAVRSAGFGIPVILRVEWEGGRRPGTLSESRIGRLFKLSGMPVSRKAGRGFSYRLYLRFTEEGSVAWLMADASGQEVLSGIDRLPDYKTRTVTLWINRLVLDLHAPRLMGDPVY